MKVFQHSENYLRQNHMGPTKNSALLNETEKFRIIQFDSKFHYSYFIIFNL